MASEIIQASFSAQFSEGGEPMDPMKMMTKAIEEASAKLESAESKALIQACFHDQEVTWWLYMYMYRMIPNLPKTKIDFQWRALSSI